MTRTSTSSPNRKHTADTMRAELELAQRSGSTAEVADLSLLIQNAERPSGTPSLPGALQARNRQGQRRYQRERTWDQNAHNTSRRAPVVGDTVQDPSGARWTVTQVMGDMLRHDVPGEMVRFAPVRMVQIVDGPSPAPAPAPDTRDAQIKACDALYQGVWDAYEVQDWAALELALRAYETALAALGV